MGGCCATSRYSIGGSTGLDPRFASDPNINTEEPEAGTFNLEVVEPTLNTSKFERAESFAIRDPQQLFRYTDVEACFKHSLQKSSTQNEK